MQDFYPRSPCGERRPGTEKGPWPSHFYPRSPCGERLGCWMALNRLLRFLSTLSLRRATFEFLATLGKLRHFYPRSPCGERHPPGFHIFRWSKDFYPRSPCGERPDMAVSYSKGIKISIHALLAESDAFLPADRMSHQEFLSTLSLRRATAGKGPAVKGYRNFYPRSPCGERRDVVYNWLPYAKFLSTLSLRRATELV